MDAEELIGKTVLVGLTHLDADGSVREQEQWYGVIVAADDDYVTVKLSSGETRTLPPTLEKAEPGEYTLRSTGEVVSNPDFVATWTVSGEPLEESTTEPRSDADWIDLYADRRGIYDVFAARLENLVETLLDEEGIAYSWVISFSVRPDSLEFELNKSRRDRVPVENPLESRLRVAGVTVGIETSVEASAIDDLIRREFAVDSAGSLSIHEAVSRTERLRNPVGLDRLTYEFPYYLVALDEQRLALPEWSRYEGLKLRIEVKTLLQDASRGIQPELPFVRGSSYPAEVRDLLAGTSVALAAVDDDLAEAQVTIARLLEEYDDAVAAGELRLPLNGVSLLAYLRTSELVRSLTELGQQVGLAYDAEYQPDWNAVEHRPLWLLQRADVHTIAELEDFLKQATPRARTTLGEIASGSTDRGFTPWAFPEAVVEFLWLVLRRADAETISLLQYHDAIEYALNTLIGNPVPAEERDGT